MLFGKLEAPGPVFRAVVTEVEKLEERTRRRRGPSIYLNLGRDD